MSRIIKRLTPNADLLSSGEFRESEDLGSVSSKVTHDGFYVHELDEITIHPMTNGLAMRESTSSVMIGGEFDEYSGITPGSINFTPTNTLFGSSKLVVTTDSSMNFRTGDFTVEFWYSFNFPFTGVRYVDDTGQYSYYRVHKFFKNTNFSLDIFVSGNGSADQEPYLFRYTSVAGLTAWTMPIIGNDRFPNFSTGAPGTWVHFALVRKNSSIELYVQGQKATVTNFNSLPGSMGQNNEDIILDGSTIDIGEVFWNSSEAGSYANKSYGGISGKVTGLRWCKEALYSNTFVPSRKYPATNANTSLLLAPTHNLQNNSINLLEDQSGNERNITVVEGNNTCVIAATSPFE
jgi:hypothetical protein